MNNLTFDAPYSRQTSENRVIPIPTLRNDFPTTGAITACSFGFVWKPIRTRSSIANDFNFTFFGLGPTLTSLDPSLRPADILNDPVVQNNRDNLFTGLFGSWNGVVGVYNYGKTAPRFLTAAVNAAIIATTNTKVMPRIPGRFVTISLLPSARVSNAIPSLRNERTRSHRQRRFGHEYTARVQNGLNGLSGNGGPLLTFGLAGKANPGAPSLYQGDKTNFSPRFAAAWNPYS